MSESSKLEDYFEIAIDGTRSTCKSCGTIFDASVHAHHLIQHMVQMHGMNFVDPASGLDDAHAPFQIGEYFHITNDTLMCKMCGQQFQGVYVPTLHQHLVVEHSIDVPAAANFSSPKANDLHDPSLALPPPIATFNFEEHEERSGGVAAATAPSTTHYADTTPSGDDTMDHNSNSSSSIPSSAAGMSRGRTDLNLLFNNVCETVLDVTPPDSSQSQRMAGTFVASEFFDISADGSFSKCKTCKKIFTGVNRGNLKRHMVLLHSYKGDAPTPPDVKTPYSLMDILKETDVVKNGNSTKRRIRQGAFVEKDFFYISADQKTSTCKNCNKIFKGVTRGNLKRHMVLVHQFVDSTSGGDSSDGGGDFGADMAPDSRKIVSPSILTQLSNGGHFDESNFFDIAADGSTCKLCQKQFTGVNRGNLKRHMVLLHSYKSSSVDQSTESSSAATIKTHNNEVSKRFRTGGVFIEDDHFFVTADRSTCKLCRTVFKGMTRGNLKRHMVLVHNFVEATKDAAEKSDATTSCTAVKSTQTRPKTTTKYDKFVSTLNKCARNGQTCCRFCVTPIDEFNCTKTLPDREIDLQYELITGFQVGFF